jgi:hypothetical protein
MLQRAVTGRCEGLDRDAARHILAQLERTAQALPPMQDVTGVVGGHVHAEAAAPLNGARISATAKDNGHFALRARGRFELHDATAEVKVRAGARGWDAVMRYARFGMGLCGIACLWGAGVWVP